MVHRLRKDSKRNDRETNGKGYYHSQYHLPARIAHVRGVGFVGDRNHSIQVLESGKRCAGCPPPLAR